MAEQALDKPIIDIQEALENLEGNAEILHEVVNLFMAGGRERLETISAAIAAGDVKTTYIKAHGVKGGASNFCAHRFTAAALELELLAKAGSLAGAADLYAVLAEQYDLLEQAVERVDWQALEAAGRV